MPKYNITPKRKIPNNDTKNWITNQNIISTSTLQL